MATIKVGGQLESVAVDEKLVDAAQVKDASRDNLSQKDINDELYSRTAQSSEELKGYVKKTDYETDKAAIKKSITDNKSAADTAIKNLQDGKFDKSQLIKSDAPLSSTDDSVYTSKKTDALIEKAKGSASTDLGTAKTELEAKIDTKLDKAKIKSKKSTTAGDVYDAPYVNTELDKKQDKLTAGTNIKIEGSTISCTIDTTLYKVVATLPAKPASGDMNKIHLVPSDETATKNVYKEYIWKGDAWEQLGEYQSTVDLTPYFKKSDITQTVTTATDKVPSGKAVTDALNSLAFVAGIVQGHYATKALIPSDAADGTYLVDANAAGTAGSYMVTVSGGSVIAQSEHLSTQKGVMYLTKDGTVWKDAQTAAWVNMGRMQTGNTWTVMKNTDGSWRGFSYQKAKAGDTVIIDGTQYTLVKWGTNGIGWLTDLNVDDNGEKKAKMNVKYVYVNHSGNVYIDDYEAGVTVDTELDTASLNPVANIVITTKVNDLQSQISAIQAEKATFTVKLTNGNGIYFVGTAIDAYIQADCSITADTITISKNGTSNVTMKSNAKQCIYHETATAGATTVPVTLTYTAKAVIGDVTKTASVSIYIVNPMYVGAGAAYADVVVEGCKQSARTSASGTYNVTVASNGQYVFFVVPSSMTINKVTLSGFDFPLLAADTTSKSGYKIYKSANTYKAGTLTLVVS